MKNAARKPVVAVGAVVFYQECVLLVKRKNPPAQAQWAIPGGKVRFGETLQQAAEREIIEETGITIKAGKPIYTFDVIEQGRADGMDFHYVIIDLEAEYMSGMPVPGDDAVEARWISRGELDQIDVNTKTRYLLEAYFGFKNES
jgi:ADP-ribose pyrophosphatase